MAAETHCTRHPEQQAGWICQRCNEGLCQYCAYRRRAGHGEIVVCAHDGEYAQPVLVPRIRGPFPALFRAAFSYPFSVRGLLTMFLGGSLIAILGYIGTTGSIAAALIVTAYLYFVVRATSLGEQDLPKATDLLLPGQVLSGLVRFVPALLTTLLPFVVYVTSFKHGQAIGTFFTDPITYLTLFVGVLWAPMAFMLAAAASPFGTIVNPVLAMRYVWRMAGPYFATIVTLALLALGTAIIYVLGRFLAATVQVSVFPVVYAAAATLYLPLVGGRMLGILLLKRGSDLGIASVPEYLVPAIDESMLQPEPLREQVSDDRPEIDFSNSPDAIELEEAPVEQEALKEEVVPIAAATRQVDLTTNSEELAPVSLPAGVIDVPEAEGLVVQHQLSMEVEGLMAGQSESLDLGSALDGDPSDLTATEPTFNAAVSAANGNPQSGASLAPSDEPTDDDVRFMAEAEDYESIVDAYRARKGAVTVLSAEELLRTAEAAQNMSDMATAAHVLRRLAHDYPDSPLAPDALLNAGILLIRELDSPADGRRLLSRLIRTYPESTAATGARPMVESGG